MKLSTGIDLLEINRIESAIARHGEHFLAKVFTLRERQFCAGKVESLAARFAAKEAAAKALGSGIVGFGFQDIEVIRAENGAPELLFHGGAAKKMLEQGWEQWSLSLSHSQNHAIAIVVALQK